MKVIPKKTFLLRQDEIEGGKKKDVIAKKGVKMEVTDREAARFFGILEMTEEDKKKLLAKARQPNSNLSRIV